jgi:hypothetical protein
LEEKEMIDLTNAPGGATHYMNVNALVFYKKDRGIWMAHCGHWEVSGNTKAYNDANCKLIPCYVWSIYNNDKPLSELNDEQRGLLFNHKCNGGSIEIRHGWQWCMATPTWSLESIYRAKQKSGRELFIDLATEIASDECETERVKELIDTFIVKLFDAGFKAPKSDK